MTMLNNVYIVSSKLMGQKERLAMIADNVANANTIGYKKQGLDFLEMVGREQGKDVGSFVSDGQPRFDFSEGSINYTRNPLDVAIEGDGFFAVDVAGTTHYTRNGQFRLNAQGQIVTSQGHNVLDVNNAPLSVPPGSSDIKITADGTLATEDGIIGNVGIFDFTPAQMQKFARVSGAMFRPEEGTQPEALEAEDISVVQGALEGSNVNPIEEMTNLIEVNRAYQAATKLNKQVEDLDQTNIRQLARMPS